MPSDFIETETPPRTNADDIGWILLFVGVVVFTLAGLLGWAKI